MEIHKLNNFNHIQNYILGGRADFIVAEKDSDIHFNYTVTQDKKDESLYYVRYKSLSSIVIGIVKTEATKVDEDIYNLPKFTLKKHIQSEFIHKAQVFNKLILYIYYLQKLPNNIEILYTGICSICGAKLTNPKYIEIGIGPTCLKNV